jgi:pimeloyl-ACP methyl ester carboxylesterase
VSLTCGEQELLDEIPNAGLAIVEGAGHFPWVEQPERFCDAALPFLRSRL